jgi:2-amino-4-hydroxy-6-hydroxymethyldihydropteridine diphosphokinase
MIFLSTGTNLGDREANLKIARRQLAASLRIVAVSPVYETAPWGYLDQPAFLNQALRVETSFSPLELLAFLKQTEVQMGRLPSLHYGPRLIDLDILFYHDQVIHLPELVIPHPQIEKRAFVLVPLADLAPDLRHPLTGESVKEMLEKIGRDGVGLYQTH